jgi:catechol 2,3-dioxygenase-like lactoylglutathione lyase family enzyme
MRVIRKVQRSCFLLAAMMSTLAAMAEEKGHFHHIHMNVSDIQKTSDFYQKAFGVLAIQYNNRIPALLADRSFLFMNRMDAAKIQNHQMTGLTHGSWSTADGLQTFQRLKSQGVEFYTPVEELFPGSTYMYAYGPDREVIEIVDIQRHHRFNHVHLVAKDEKQAEQTAQWFESLVASEKPATTGKMGDHTIRNLNIDGIAFTVLPIGARFTPRENDGTLRHTEGTQLDHLAFSFRDLPAAYSRIRKMGVGIVRPMKRDPDYGFYHLFVRAPNGVLVELVEAKPWPEAAWE